MATSHNAADTRQTFAVLLETARVATELSVEVVYDYEKGNLGQRRTVLEVTSRGTGRPRFTLQGRQPHVYLDVLILIAYWDDAGWTEDDAEDRLDLVEAQVMDVINANTRKAGSWKLLDVADRSTTEFVIVGGLEFKRMTIPLKFEI